jgi:hypothetical protein
VVNISPSEINFGGVPMGSTSQPQTVILSNAQNIPLTVTSITLGNSQFAETDTCTASPVPAFGFCSINVTFTPSGTGSQVSSLSVVDGVSPTPENPQAVELVGSGQAVPTPSPIATASLPPTLNPTSLMFTSQALGTTSGAQTVTLTNNSDAPLTVASIAVNSGAFAETDNCTTGPVSGFGKCTINVTFTPAFSGTQTGLLVVNDGFQSVQSPQSVQLVGVGAPAAPTPSAAATPSTPTLVPSSLSFSSTVGTTTQPQTVTVINTSSSLPLVITSIGVTGPFAETDTCTTQPVAPSGHCTISVTFTPTAKGGVSGSVTLMDNAATDALHPQSVQLVGVGS